MQPDSSQPGLVFPMGRLCAARRRVAFRVLAISGSVLVVRTIATALPAFQSAARSTDVGAASGHPTRSAQAGPGKADVLDQSVPAAAAASTLVPVKEPVRGRELAAVPSAVLNRFSEGIPAGGWPVSVRRLSRAGGPVIDP